MVPNQSDKPVSDQIDILTYSQVDGWSTDENTSLDEQEGTTTFRGILMGVALAIAMWAFLGAAICAAASAAAWISEA